MKHLALTDHGNLFGALEFHNMCRIADINPVIGSEVYVAPGSRFDKPQSGPKSYHMVLYAKNEKGYKNLIKLTSLGYTEGFYYRPRIDDELLEQYHEGLMASSACLAGEIARKIISGNRNEALNKVCYYRDLFGIDNYFLEIMNHGIPEEEAVREGISWLNKKTGLPVIATNDVHYLDKEHATAQDILICISTGKKRSDKERIKHDAPEYYFKSEEEMRELFPDFPEAIENTLMVAEKCDLEIPQPGPLLPHYEIPEEFPDQIKYLQHLTFKGLNQRYPGVTGNDREKLNARASYELKVLAGMGYEGYFLIVWDFIHWARNNKIPVGPGRGSGAGSIVAYALKITDIDPIKYDLLFERFLNPERISMPDFDIDFCFERRSEVIDYINEKYGYKNVAGICTFGTLKTKAVIKDVARVLDIPFEISNLITNLIPYSSDMNIQTALESIPKLREYRDQGGVYEELFNVANILEGMNRHFSTHACGRVIGQSELTNFVPIIKDPKSGETITAYNMDMIESCGLVKMDILGLKTLTILYDCEKLIQQKNPEFKLAEIPEDDNPTFKMLSEGKSDAIFQFEGQGMQRVLIEAKPESISDLTALNALYRPGPMQNINQFVESRHGRRKITYPHKDIADILKTTYGVIVYQEQVMRVAQIIAGFSLAKADILRRAMGKKKVDEMAKMEKDFINGALKKGYDERLAKSIFTMLVPFAGYGFNKSHAVAYSLIAYKTAYCKAHYPAEFWASNLSNWMDSFEKMENYIRSARLSNMEILPPDINVSRQRFTVSGKSIIYGLMGIKGLGQSAVNNIISERNSNGPYKNFIDFMERNDLKTVNRKAVESCIRTGLFDKIEDKTRSTLMESLTNTFDIIIRNKREETSGKVPSLKIRRKKSRLILSGSKHLNGPNRKNSKWKRNIWASTSLVIPWILPGQSGKKNTAWTCPIFPKKNQQPGKPSLVS